MVGENMSDKEEITIIKDGKEVTIEVPKLPANPTPDDYWRWMGAEPIEEKEEK